MEVNVIFIFSKKKKRRYLLAWRAHCVVDQPDHQKLVASEGSVLFFSAVLFNEEYSASVARLFIVRRNL